MTEDTIKIARKRVKKIISELRKLKSGDYYQYPDEISPYSIDAILDILNHSINNDNQYKEKAVGSCILADIHGCDLDWGLMEELEIEGKKYDVWGCVSLGSFMFQQK